MSLHTHTDLLHRDIIPGVGYRYELDLNSVGDLPITLKVAKRYLKVENDEDNAIIQDMIATVVQFAERYTGRDLRKNIWKLIIDEFADRILIRKSQVNTIDQIQYTVGGVLTTIASTVFILKKGYGFSEVLLREDQEWPDDLDEVEAGIEITFATQIPRYIEQYKSGVLEHLAFLYQNRGDCDVNSAALRSGASQLYDQGRIQRI